MNLTLSVCSETFAQGSVKKSNKLVFQTRSGLSTFVHLGHSFLETLLGLTDWRDHMCKNSLLKMFSGWHLWHPCSPPWRPRSRGSAYSSPTYTGEKHVKAEKSDVPINGQVENLSGQESKIKSSHSPNGWNHMCRHGPLFKLLSEFLCFKRHLKFGLDFKFNGNNFDRKFYLTWDLKQTAAWA